MNSIKEYLNSPESQEQILEKLSKDFKVKEEDENNVTNEGIIEC